MLFKIIAQSVYLCSHSFGPPVNTCCIRLYNYILDFAWDAKTKETVLLMKPKRVVKARKLSSSLLQGKRAAGAHWPRCPWSCSRSRCRSQSCSRSHCGCWSRPWIALHPHCYCCRGAAETHVKLISRTLKNITFIKSYITIHFATAMAELVVRRRQGCESLVQPVDQSALSLACNFQDIIFQMS